MLSTRRLLLRRFVLADAPKLLAMSHEAGLRRWIPDQVYRDERHAEEVVRALIDASEGRPEPRVRPYVLGLEDRGTGALVGHVGLSPARNSVEIGYAIEERAQGRGLATEAVAAMAAWAVSELGLPEVLGIVDADNLPSCRVLEKAGFVKTGEDRRTGGRGTLLVYRRVASPRPAVV